MSDNENYEIDEQEELDTGAEYTEEEEISDEQLAEIREEARKKAYYEDEALTWNDIKQHLAAPIISLILNIVLVTLICIADQTVAAPVEENEKEILVKQEDETPPPEPPEPPKPPELKEEDYVQETTDPVESTFQNNSVVRDSPARDNAPMEVQTEAPATAETSDTNFSDSDMMMDTNLPQVQASNSRLKLSGAFAARSGAGRAAMLKKYAGGHGSKTERAVMQALRWLVKVQNEDGSWGDFQDDYRQKVQLTCLALLCFLAHGETTQSEQFGPALEKGLQKVLEWSKRGSYETGLNESGKTNYGHIDGYAHARIAIVLAEGYAITKIPALERGMERAVAKIIRRLNPQGGFDCHLDETGKRIDRFNLDEGNRLYNAIYCAYHAGCELEVEYMACDTKMKVNMEKAIELSINAMNKHHAYKRGGFGYGNVGGRDAAAGRGDYEASAAGTLFLYLMGSNSNAAQKGYEWLCRFKTTGEEGSELRMDWKAESLPSKTPALTWYYVTQALFQGSSASEKGARNWKRWNGSMAKSLVEEQHHEGYWLPPADKYPKYRIQRVATGKRGKFKEQKVEQIYNESTRGGFTDHNAKIWCTVYFTLCLEVYYRYLPTFQPDGSKTPLVIGDASEAISDNKDNSAEENVGDDEISLD